MIIVIVCVCLFVSIAEKEGGAQLSCQKYIATFISYFISSTFIASYLVYFTGSISQVFHKVSRFYILKCLLTLGTTCMHNFFLVVYS